MKFFSVTNQPQNEPLIFQFNHDRNTSLGLDSANLKIRNNNIIFFISGTITENPKNISTPDQKEKKLSFTTVMEKNINYPFQQKYLFCDFKNYSPDSKNHHIILNPQENSIDCIYSNNNLNYMHFSSTSIFREEFILRKNKLYKKIIWNKLHTNKLIGLNLDNTIELIDIEKLNDESSFNLGEQELIRDIIHLERGDLRDMLLISGENNLMIYDPKR